MRGYAYVGPADLLAQAGAPTGVPITSPADAERWLSGQDAAEPCTFVVDLAGTLLLAPRRSEHVACAGGEPVRSAGEITFADGAVSEISNQSTGYCPDPGSWPAVADALDRAGLARPDGFTAKYVFRRCSSCAQLNIVKDEHFFCAVCDGPLPRQER